MSASDWASAKETGRGWIADTICEALHWRHIREFIADAPPGSHFKSAFEEWSDARLHFTPMIGYTARDFATGKILVLGGVLWLGGRLPHAITALTPEFAADKRRSRWVHRAALEILDLAHRHSTVIYSWPDLEVPGAEQWMRRLGFAPPADDNTEYWTHAVPRAPGPNDRRVHHDDCASDNHIASDPASAGGGRGSGDAVRAERDDQGARGGGG